MGKNLITKAVEAIIRCSACKGSGQVAHYIQGCNDVIDKHGRRVAYTDCTRFKTCPTCGGSGRFR
ncbi:hypothetical protein B5D80_25850 [Micromonospora wenchangensis]|uniref:Molecular chaperone DnaJ n=1 Tax=Micromonospora wenchangensis TaxID=1185415 RepID=A0A246RFJ3_9ACTN|nr:hypothetical protein [Micromonospora wenchangensis]OWV01626.1 hypothetical protein B5D80_25850 [Micromonospora wenchangensis]